mgnify:CR=1 FL=1
MRREEKMLLNSLKENQSMFLNAIIDLVLIAIVVWLATGLYKDEVDYRREQRYRKEAPKRVAKHIREKFGRN